MDFLNDDNSGAGVKMIGAITESMLHHDIGAQIV